MKAWSANSGYILCVRQYVNTSLYEVWPRSDKNLDNNKTIPGFGVVKYSINVDQGRKLVHANCSAVALQYDDSWWLQCLDQ